LTALEEEAELRHSSFRRCVPANPSCWMYGRQFADWKLPRRQVTMSFDSALPAETAANRSI